MVNPPLKANQRFERQSIRVSGPLGEDYTPNCAGENEITYPSGADIRVIFSYMLTMNYPANIQDMIEDFTFLDDWEDRYMHVIDLGKGLPALPEEVKTDANKVKGCASQVWLVSSQDNDIWHFSGDSDAHIVKGLVAIVLEIFSGRTAAQIRDLDANAILAKLGLSEHLSAQRSNGLASMIGRIKAEAAAS